MMNRLINSLVTHSFPTSVPEHKIMFMIINLMRIERTSIRVIIVGFCTLLLDIKSFISLLIFSNSSH